VTHEGPRSGLAISTVQSDNETGGESRDREASLQGRVSAKAKGLLRRFDEDLAVRYAERTVPEYVAHLRAFLAWLQRLPARCDVQ
jgi:hypothetical protein